jgi:chitodextrinase
MLSGAAGQLYGNGYTWPFRSGWKANLDTPGSAQLAHLIALLAPPPPLPPRAPSRKWWNLIPDQNHLVVVGGNGTFSSSGSLGASDYLTAARTPDGALVLAYLPTVRTITVEMAKLGGPADASWFDPSNGASHPIAGSPFPNSGRRILTPPGQNADGDGDWVLVLEAPSVPPDTQPPTAPTALSASGVTDSQAILAWTASTDDVAVAAYQLFRDGVLVRTTRFDTVRDDGLAPSTSYTYTVAALDYADNVSAPSLPLVVTTSAPQPQFVQQNYATPQTPELQVAVTYLQAQTAGDTNILAIGWNDTTASIQSVVDSAGNSYQAAVSTFRGSGLSQAIWFAPNIVAAAAGVNQVTVTFDQPAVFVDLRITEYARLRATNPFDAGTSSSGSGVSATTGFVQVSAASELLFAAGMTSTTFTGPGSGYASEVITNPDGDLVEDAIAPAPGSDRATAPLNDGAWLLQLAVFQAQ